MALHVDYKSAFDSMSHIYLFKALQKAGASLKTLQLYKAIYTTVKLTVKVNSEVTESFTIGRGLIEGDITSPMYFNVGLEAVFREADAVNSAVVAQDGIDVEGLNVDKVGFADDVQLLSTGGVDRLSARIQQIQAVSEPAGLRVSTDKTYAQHIGRDAEAPRVTSADIKSLKPSIRCPVPWCTRVFNTRSEMRGHELSHKCSKKRIMDQSMLAKATILSVRGPPERRFYLVTWLGENVGPRWLEEKHFQGQNSFLVDAYFYIHFYLDRNSNLEAPGEHRCVQCNKFLVDPEALRAHVEAEHMFPAKPGTMAYRKAFVAVQQKHQQSLPKVRLRGGIMLDNKYKATWLGMALSANGNDEEHVKHSILLAKIKFGQYRLMMRSKRLWRSIKIANYKGLIVSRATFGCEAVDLTQKTIRRYKAFNAECLACISGRSRQAEMRKPSFDLLAWIRWRRLVWFGKCMRGTKGAIVLHTLKWNFANRSRGDIFQYLPGGLPTTFDGLRQAAMDLSKWQQLCDEQKPPPWTVFDTDGNIPSRRSKRLASKASNERSIQRNELRRQLAGTHAQRWPPPTKVSHGEVHVYTDGSVAGTGTGRRAGCGIWFADNSKFNISTNPGGNQTSSRAELTAVILALRKARNWPTLYSRITVHSDSMYCVNGVNKWLQRWKMDGWTRSGSPLRNVDLWKLLSKVLDKYQQEGIEVALLYVPAHVGVYGNERADRLAKAAARRARRNASLTREQLDERIIEEMADAIVSSVLANM